MTNTEKNRLIEAFMGWELKWVAEYNLNQWCFVNKRRGCTETGVYNVSEKPYCTDWSELMDAIGFFDNLIEYNSLKLTSSQSIEYSMMCDQIDHAVTLYNIDDTVNALCEGIEWYNSTLN